MLCTEEMGTLLSRYVDNELDDAERKSVEAHLEKCASCRDVFNLFMRNDNVLNNALVGEAFGAQTVDAVMTEIRRLEEPMVVAPAVEEEPAPAPVAMRQIIQVTRMWPFAAAAAVMIACLGGFLAVAKYGGFGGSERTALDHDLARTRQALAEAQESSRVTTQTMVDRVRDMSKEMRDLEVRFGLKSSPENIGLAYVNDRAIVVQANYSTEKFGPFTLYRCREIKGGGGRYDPWIPLREDLAVPFYRDETADPGVRYLYMFRAKYKDDPKKVIDSASMEQMLPFAGGLDPRKSLRIRFIGALPDRSQGTFQVSRYENQTLISRIYTVKVGERIGSVETVDGKEIDFTTRFSFQSVADIGDSIQDSAGNVIANWMTRKATLKADSTSRDRPAEQMTITLDGEQYVPLPK
ncbi:MAG TPA: zf-HC2 domain-containing protein [Planctomycetota bacterium]|jgi:negative regulator of sigma E activity